MGLTLMNLSEAYLLPEQATLGHNLMNPHEQLNEVVYFQGSCTETIYSSVAYSKEFSRTEILI